MKTSGDQGYQDWKIINNHFDPGDMDQSIRLATYVPETRQIGLNNSDSVSSIDAQHFAAFFK